MSNDEQRAYLESAWSQVEDTGYTITVGGNPSHAFRGSIHRISLAAEFTEAWLEKIRQAQEEIAWLERVTYHYGNEPPKVRILAARQSVLADLCCGIKPEKLEEMGVKL